MKQTVQWQGNNVPEIERLLIEYVARADKHGDMLHIVGLGGLDVSLRLGDSVVVEGNRLGIIRAAEQVVVEPWVTWDGNNLAKIAAFAADWEIAFDVIGADLHLCGADRAVLKRGDRLIKRLVAGESGPQVQLIVSKVGRDHRM